MTRDVIISLTPGKTDAIARAQRQANEHREPYGVWEHVGLYGQLGGDTPRRNALKTQPLSRPDPSDDWALIACVDPEGSGA